MVHLKFTPITHDHAAFLARARKRKGFTTAYESLVLEYQLASQLLKARSRAGMTQDALAERSRPTILQGASRQPSLKSTQRLRRLSEC